MAEKNENAKTLTEETAVKEVVSATSEKTKPAAIQQVDPWAWRKEAEAAAAEVGEDQAESENVFRPGIMVSSYKSPGRDGAVYTNYAIGFVQKIGDKELVQTIYLDPPQKTRTAYDMLEAIFGAEEQRPLEIVVTSMSNGGVLYSYRVSALDNDGAEVSCSLRPKAASDKNMMQNLINILKKRGLLG